MAKISQQAELAKIHNLLASLPQPQQDAVQIIKTALDCYNSYGGVGLFVGMHRYKVLQDRLKIAALSSQSLFDFWANLLRRMMWKLPPKAADGLIVGIITDKDDMAVLQSIINDTPSLVTLARMLHDADKETRREIWRDEQAELHALEQAAEPIDNQPLDF